jgi:uncharacterized OsmC-like protein
MSLRLLRRNPAMTETAALTCFDVIFDVEARNTAKFRNDITVHLRGQHPATVELPTDEGPKHGGNGTAPYPLAYFASGLTACVMTQLRAFSRRLDIPLTTIAINTRCIGRRSSAAMPLTKARRSRSQWTSISAAAPLLRTNSASSTPRQRAVLSSSR